MAWLLRADDLLGALDQALRRIEDFPQGRLGILPVQRIDDQVRAAGVLLELGRIDGAPEPLAQTGELHVGSPRRCGEGPRQLGGAVNDAHDPAFVVVARQIVGHRGLAEGGMRLPAHLNDRHQLARCNFLALRPERGRRPERTHRLDFPGLHGEPHPRGAAIAFHDLDVVTQHVLQQQRVLGGRRALSGRAEDEPFGPGFLDALDARAARRGAARRILGQGADPADLVHVVAHVLAAEQKGDGVGRRGQHDPRAVLRTGVEDVVERLDAARTRHVLHDDAWVARHVLAEMRLEEAREGVGAAAGAEADDQCDRLAAIEILGRIGAGLRRGDEQRGAPGRCGQYLANGSFDHLEASLMKIPSGCRIMDGGAEVKRDHGANICRRPSSGAVV